MSSNLISFFIPMHHALHLPEILYNIFGHLAPAEDWQWIHERLPYTSDLAALARTCRTFKEPALDVLWSELPDLSALARCVPEAIYSPKSCHYAFQRPLTEAEWAVVQSYSCRVWIFLNCTLMEMCLQEDCIAMLFNYTGGALFPNLRFLSWYYGRPFPLVHVASPQLRILHLDFKRAGIPGYRNILESAGTLCPLIKRFQLILPRQYAQLDGVISGHVLRWSNIWFLDCREVALNADAILHLSRMSTPVHLGFILNEEIPEQILPSDFMLVFPNLSFCEITSGWLLPIVKLLARIQLPKLKELVVRFPGTPSKQTLRSFMTTLKGRCSADTFTHLSVLSQRYLVRRLCSCDSLKSVDHSLAYDDLYPCTAFDNLRSLKINLEQSVDLTDNDLVDLASAWPRLEELFVNHDSGWHTPGGITLYGLIRLFRTCPSLRSFSLLLDTPTFVRIPEGMDVSYPPRQMDQVNLVDSPLGVEMFAGVVNVFVMIGFSPRLLFAWIRSELEAVFLEGPQARLSWRDVDAEVKMRLAQNVSGVQDGQLHMI